MRHLHPFLTTIFLIASSHCIALNSPLNTTDNLAVRKPEDIDVQTIEDAGSPLPSKNTILFLHIVMLDIYKSTLLNGKDEVVPEAVWERDFAELELQLAPREASKLTWADALWGVQGVLRNMLYPVHCSGFREQRWEIGRNTKERGIMIKLGEILIKLKKTPQSATTPASNSSSRAFALSKKTPFIPSPLSAPFPVPDTDLTLLIGARGISVPRAGVIQALDGMVSKGYLDFAVHQHARRLPQQTAKIDDPAGTTYVTMRPRMQEGTSLLTTTDLVEMAIGIVYFMLRNRFVATTITAVRPDESGKRIAVGEMEIEWDGRVEGLDGLGDTEFRGIAR